MRIGSAVEELEKGHRVARTGWNGKNMFLFIPGSDGVFHVEHTPAEPLFPEGTILDSPAPILMKTAENTIIPWTCSQTDLRASDWMVV